MNIFTFAIISFFIFSLLNVILQTLKSILTVNGSTLVAMVINAITFGFYTVVMKQLGTVDLTTSVIVTVVTNLIGVYISIQILNKIKKDKLWKIEATVNNNDSAYIEKELNENNISYSLIQSLNKKIVIFNIYCYSQKESLVLKPLLKEVKAKYTVYESNLKL